MIYIPEIAVETFLLQIIAFVKEEYLKNTDKKQSFLAVNFGSNSIDGVSLVDFAKQILLGETKNRQVKTTIGFNLERAVFPTYHVIIPSEEYNAEVDAIGTDEGYIYNAEHEGSNQRTRGFKTSVSIICTSSNLTEVIVLYNFLKIVFINYRAELDLAGMRDLKLGGQELTLQQDLIPLNIHHRIFTFSFFYEYNVVNLDPKQNISSLNFEGNITDGQDY